VWRDVVSGGMQGAHRSRRLLREGGDPQRTEIFLHLLLVAVKGPHRIRRILSDVSQQDLAAGVFLDPPGHVVNLQQSAKISVTPVAGWCAPLSAIIGNAPRRTTLRARGSNVPAPTAHLAVDDHELTPVLACRRNLRPCQRRW